MGDSVPCSVIDRDRVADGDAELAREVLAEQDAARHAFRFGRISASIEPCCIAARRSVTVASSAGSMPVRLTNSSDRAAVISALPRIAGAAPVTCGIRRRMSDSAR